MSKRGVRFASASRDHTSNSTSHGIGVETGSQAHGHTQDGEHTPHGGALSDASFSLKSVWFSDVELCTDKSVSDVSESDVGSHAPRKRSRSHSRSLPSKVKSLSEVGSLGGLSLYFSDLEGNSECGLDLSPRSGIDSVSLGWTNVFGLRHGRSVASPVPVRAVSSGPLPVAKIRHYPRRVVVQGAVVQRAGSGVCAIVNRYTDGVDVQQWGALCGVADRRGLICPQFRLLCGTHTHLRTSGAQLSYLKARCEGGFVSGHGSERFGGDRASGAASIGEVASRQWISGGVGLGFATVTGYSRTRRLATQPTSLQTDLDTVRAIRALAVTQRQRVVERLEKLRRAAAEAQRDPATFLAAVQRSAVTQPDVPVTSLLANVEDIPRIPALPNTDIARFVAVDRAISDVVLNVASKCSHPSGECDESCWARHSSGWVINPIPTLPPRFHGVITHGEVVPIIGRANTPTSSGTARNKQRRRTIKDGGRAGGSSRLWRRALKRSIPTEQYSSSDESGSESLPVLETTPRPRSTRGLLKGNKQRSVGQ